jgi:hypothetical protein
VGKVGVPVAHLGHMRELLNEIPVGEMNTSMTINATAAWLWGLYLAYADEQNVPFNKLAGTTQNDIVKEYLSRGTFIFPPQASKRLIVDMIAYGINNVPKWKPINVCSYHLQEAGATPVQEIAYALATAIDILDGVRDSGKISPDQLPEVVGRISFFVNAGIRFVEEIAKMRDKTLRDIGAAKEGNRLAEVNMQRADKARPKPQPGDSTASGRKRQTRTVTPRGCCHQHSAGCRRFRSAEPCTRVVETPSDTHGIWLRDSQTGARTRSAPRAQAPADRCLNSAAQPSTRPRWPPAGESP